MYRLSLIIHMGYLYPSCSAKSGKKSWNLKLKSVLYSFHNCKKQWIVLLKGFSSSAECPTNQRKKRFQSIFVARHSISHICWYAYCTVGSEENFQIWGQKIFFEISGPGPSYTSIGSSQDHIWSYFEHICWGAQVQCGGVEENGLLWGISV